MQKPVVVINNGTKENRAKWWAKLPFVYGNMGGYGIVTLVLFCASFCYVNNGCPEI
jgi:hypothetical protein